MNIINRFFLKVALLPIGIYQRLGVQPPILKAILTTKLMMDDRRPNTFHQTQYKKKETPISMATVGTMVLSAVMGVLYLMAFAFGNNIVTQLTLYFSFFFFMLAATLVSDFTSVLIDVRDNFIILPKPVNDRTFVTARLLHIFIHICKLIVPMSLPGLVYMGIYYGLAGSICFFLMILMVTLFTIFFINALYIVVLKVTTPQKFQAIISYVQIFFAIAIYASYQVVPRLLGQFGDIPVDFSKLSYSIFIPPYWFASGWNTLYTFRLASSTALVAAIVSMVIPVLSLWIVVKYLAPSFNKILALITVTNAEATPKAKRSATTANRYMAWLGRLCTKEGAERIGFLFSWKMTSRSRDFKLKVYPSIGYLLVYAVLMFMTKKSIQLQDIQDQTTAGKTIVIAGLYFSSILFITAIQQVSFSEKYKAAWMFYTTPISKPGEVISGSIKAIILKFYIPLVILISVACLVVIGIKILPNLVLGLFNVWLIALLVAYMGYKQLPFSQQQSNNSKSGNFIKVLAIMLVTAFIALLHYLVYTVTIVVGILAVLSIIAAWLVIGGIKNTSWQQLKGGDADY